MNCMRWLALVAALALTSAACEVPSHAEARLNGRTEVELRVSMDQQSLYVTVWVTQYGDKVVQFDSNALVLSLANGIHLLRSEQYYSPYPSPGGTTPGNS